jgi:aldose 1-epimerase
VIGDRQPSHFGVAPDGDAVHRVTLKNGGVTASFITWGASLQDLRISGVAHSLVLGSPVFEAYLTAMKHFGAIAGRVANRIANGRAELDGRTLELDRNENGQTTLHGGAAGSSVSNWSLDGFDASSCRMSLRMQDGAAGFPGNLDLTVVYRLDGEGALIMEIEGVTDAPTFCNAAHHSYWNLSGAADLSGHCLTVHAERYLDVDSRKIPTGAPWQVEGTRFDFRTPRPVTGEGQEPLDHNLCLRDAPGQLREVGVLEAGELELRLFTTEPGLQVYDGKTVDTTPSKGHDGAPYGPFAGVALEPQRWPDAPNHRGYPSIVLRPGETYSQVSKFHIRWRNANSEEDER